MVSGYYREGFLTLQAHIDRALADSYSVNQVTDINVQMKRSPYPPYLDDKFILVLQMQLPFIILLSFIFPALNIVKDLVHEKERKLKVLCLAEWKGWQEQ